MAPRTVAIVPHTHWDREWYSPFQTFRLRLVDLLDGFLDHLETDPSYARFLLDGQMAVVDDYLEVRPEAEERLRKLAASGRLAMGPWYILMDEFLVSGETMWRDLQLGLDKAASFGGAMQVGYLPDMFGHVAQMPQILRHAGIDKAVVWRGVPSAINRTAFWWSAPDGSTVRAEYLPQGYGNGASIPEDAKALLRRVKAHEEELGELLAPGAPILFMNGTDHEVPQSWLGRVVAEANDLQDEYRFVVTSLAEHAAEAPTEGLPEWTGELRSGARANLLMGVASNRTDVKQAAARTERALERLAEPLCALHLPADRWPARLLQLAWQQVIRNAAHDSICACSVDEVCDAVLHRFAEARQIADGLARRALNHLATTLPTAGTYAVNPASHGRGGLLEVVVPGEGPLPHAQVLEARPATVQDVTIPGSELPSIIGQIRSQQLDARTYINRAEVEETEAGLDVVLHADARLRENLLVEEVKRDLYARVGARPDCQVRVRIVQPATRRALVRVDEVPGFGWTPVDATTAPARPAAPVTVTVTDSNGTALTNGTVTVEVDPATGTFALNGLAGFDRLVDDGDHGDTYNYSPPDHDVVVDEPEHVAVDVIESGPLRGRLEVRRTYRWPERIDDETRARTGERTVVVTTRLEVRAGEPLVHVHTTFDNPCRDHRLRAHFPLPEPAATSTAECAFATVERGLTAEGGPTETGLPTFPSRRFVQAGGMTVLHEGLLEYELVDIDEPAGGPAQARTLALTLLRSTGMLSRVEMTYRPLPAGPPIHMEGSQSLGPVEARYALHVGDGDPYQLVDDAFLPLLRARSQGGGPAPATGSALTVDGAVVSAVTRVPGAIEVRLFNPSATPRRATFGARSGWTVDLRSRPLSPFEGGVDLGPWEIVTVRLPDVDGG